MPGTRADEQHDPHVMGILLGGEKGSVFVTTASLGQDEDMHHMRMIHMHALYCTIDPVTLRALPAPALPAPAMGGQTSSKLHPPI